MSRHRVYGSGDKSVTNCGDVLSFMHSQYSMIFVPFKHRYTSTICQERDQV